MLGRSSIMAVSYSAKMESHARVVNYRTTHEAIIVIFTDVDDVGWFHDEERDPSSPSQQQQQQQYQ
jgi:hypothetical protein